MVSAESSLLTGEENARLACLLGPRRHSLSTSVAQLLFGQPPCFDTWAKWKTGVVTFTKDFNRRSFFLQLYDLKAEQTIWEQELYEHFTYDTTCQFLHAFEGDKCPVGLNFADDTEASMFATAVRAKLSQLQRRWKRSREKHRRDASPPAEEAVALREITGPFIENTGVPGMRRMSSVLGESDASPPADAGPQEAVAERQPPTPSPAAASRRTSFRSLFRRRSNSSKVQLPKKRLSKGDIGLPTDFRHPQHVGFDAASQEVQVTAGEEDGPLVAAFLQIVGVNAGDQNRKIVIDFIKEHGGMGRLREELKGGAPLIPVIPEGSAAPSPAAAAANVKYKTFRSVLCIVGRLLKDQSREFEDSRAHHRKSSERASRLKRKQL